VSDPNVEYALEELRRERDKLNHRLLALEDTVARRFSPTRGHTHTATANNGPTLANTALALVYTDWTPTVSQLGSVPITTNEAKYCIIGKMAHVYAMLTVNNTGATGNNAVAIGSIPAVLAPALVSAYVTLGTFVIANIDVGYYQGSVVAYNATYFYLVAHGQNNNVGIAPNFQLAVPDVISVNLQYRVA
jgi:hypothetical protein